MSDVPEMVERVARAMAIALGGDPDHCAFGSGSSDGGLQCHRRLWEEYLPHARAAIRAMREPTGDGTPIRMRGNMQRRGAAKMWDVTDRRVSGLDMAAEIYRAMIDAALGEGEG